MGQLQTFRRKPITVQAVQWFKNGDHPDDGNETYIDATDKSVHLWEGKVVRYYRHPMEPGERLCQHCQIRMHDHGWIDTVQGGHTVCPGDWIITELDGKGYYPCKPAVFAATYALDDVKAHNLERHRMLHRSLDELVACFIEQGGIAGCYLPSKTTLGDFMAWAFSKTKETAPPCGPPAEKAP